MNRFRLNSTNQRVEFSEWVGQYHRNSRTRTLAESRDIADLWRSKMVPTKRQNNGGIGDQLTRANY